MPGSVEYRHRVRAPPPSVVRSESTSHSCDEMSEFRCDGIVSPVIDGVGIFPKAEWHSVLHGGPDRATRSPDPPREPGCNRRARGSSHERPFRAVARQHAHATTHRAPTRPQNQGDPPGAGLSARTAGVRLCSTGRRWRHRQRGTHRGGQLGRHLGPGPAARRVLLGRHAGPRRLHRRVLLGLRRRQPCQHRPEPVAHLPDRRALHRHALGDRQRRHHPHGLDRRRGRSARELPADRVGGCDSDRGEGTVLRRVHLRELLRPRRHDRLVRVGLR